MYVGNFEAGVRAVDMSGELRGDLYAQGREIGSIWTGAEGGYRANLPMAWGAQPHKGYVYATDMNSGVWVGKLTRQVRISGPTILPSAVTRRDALRDKQQSSAHYVNGRRPAEPSSSRLNFNTPATSSIASTKAR